MGNDSALTNLNRDEICELIKSYETIIDKNIIKDRILNAMLWEDIWFKYHIFNREKQINVKQSTYAFYDYVASQNII